ncbi:MAG: hypothetical protein ACO3KD_08560, partial [Gaiellales bacterium]
VMLLLPIASVATRWLVSLVMGGARRDAIARLGRGAAATAQGPNGAPGPRMRARRSRTAATTATRRRSASPA